MATVAVYESPVLREQFGAKGRDIVLGEFDEEIVIEKTLNVYQGLI
ncbi:MAG: glycosyltransferase [Trichloromonadaceae bacterium]